MALLEQTAWKMEKFSAYSQPHLLILIGIFISIAIIIYLARNFNEKQSTCFLFSLGVFMFFIELYKHLFYTFIVNGGQYPWWIFPFQLCSIPIYLLLALPFIKEKHKSIVFNFLATYNLMGGFISLFEPSGLTHPYLSLTIHAFVWHGMLVLVGFYLIVTKRAVNSQTGFKKPTQLFLGLSLLAFLINVALGDVSNGTVNMFFVGPPNNPILVFKDISSKFGWMVTTPLFLISVIIGAYIFYAITEFFQQGKTKDTTIRKKKGTDGEKLQNIH